MHPKRPARAQTHTHTDTHTQTHTHTCLRWAEGKSDKRIALINPDRFAGNACTHCGVDSGWGGAGGERQGQAKCE